MATNVTQNPTTKTPPPNPQPTNPANPTSLGTPGTTQTASQSAQAHPSSLHPSQLNPSRANEPAGPFGNRDYQPGAPREGRTARANAQQAAPWSSDLFLWGALGAMGGALLLRTANQKQASLWLGQWVSPLLLFGVYNRLVSLGGSGTPRS